MRNTDSNEKLSIVTQYKCQCKSTQVIWIDSSSLALFLMNSLSIFEEMETKIFISVLMNRVIFKRGANLLHICFASYSANTKNINVTTLKINVII